MQFDFMHPLSKSITLLTAQPFTFTQTLQENPLISGIKTIGHLKRRFTFQNRRFQYSCASK